LRIQYAWNKHFVPLTSRTVVEQLSFPTILGVTVPFLAVTLHFRPVRGLTRIQRSLLLDLLPVTFTGYPAFAHFQLYSRCSSGYQRCHSSANPTT